MSSCQNIAFFGATGGCTIPALELSLRAGHNCRALARTPTRLINMLKARNVSATTIDQHLHVVKGEATNVEAVKACLNFSVDPHVSNDLSKVILPDIIIAGLGGKPTFQWSLARPLTMPQKRICAEAARGIIAALESFEASGLRKFRHPAPLFAQIAAIGVAQEYRDWPLIYYPITRWLLNGDIFEDKREAHQAALDAASRGLIRPVSLRPATLMGGAGKGLDHVLTGLDDKPVIGWTIKKEDVGAWMFEKLIDVGSEAERERFIGRNVTLAN